MKVLVTGAAGRLGRDVTNELNKRGVKVMGADIDEMDITDYSSVERAMHTFVPDGVIHCAAWTAVDAAEDNEGRVRLINAEGAKNVATACRAVNAKMIYLSTDYVFGGEGDEPRAADSTDYNPLNVYGKSKLEGEFAVASILKKFFIVRTSWVFGPYGASFINTLLKLAEERESVRVACDQIGTPTYTVDLARLLADMIITRKYGYYNAVNEGGYISRAALAEEVFKMAGLSVKVIPVLTKDYGSVKAARPLNGRLDTLKLKKKGFSPLPDWRNAVERYLRGRRIDSLPDGNAE